MAAGEPLSALLLVLGSVALFVAVWRALVRRHRVRGRGPWFRHILGALTASFVSVIGLMAFAPVPFTVSVMFAALAAAIFVLAWRIPTRRTASRAPTATAPARRTESRPDRDATAGNTRASPRKQRTARRAMIDDVQFAYCDANGSHTDRRVAVQLVDAAHFEGYCFLRAANRTFRFENIIGSVTRMSTGEILSVDEWRTDLAR